MFFDDFKVGDSFVSGRRRVTEADIVAFAVLSGDFNPIHMDADYAKTTTFGERIAHGLLVLSIASGLTVQSGLTNESIIAFYGIDRLRFTKPVFIGDTIRTKSQVLEVTPKENRGIVTFETTVVNQNDDAVLVFIKRLLLKCKQQ